jgi:hypothetical protein
MDQKLFLLAVAIASLCAIHHIAYQQGYIDVRPTEMMMYVYAAAAAVALYGVYEIYQRIM